ncbi:MAG: efflux RND transporter periplasmic adaptor subunit [Bryobacteraceae bacterium]
MSLFRNRAEHCCAALALLALSGLSYAADVAPVVSKNLDRKLQLPGEFLPFQIVTIHAKVTGFVDKIQVDVGSNVKKGDLLATLVAPELKAHRMEAEAKVRAIESQRAEAQAKVAAAESTYERLKAASATPGVVAGNDLVQAEKAVDVVRGQGQAIEGSVLAARSAIEALRDMESYLQVTAPFDGTITERKVHPGALVGPGGSGPANAMFELQQNFRLRLVVSVPEVAVSGIVKGGSVPFTTAAYPGETFHGTVARNPRTMDQKTRSMNVELDVQNAQSRLAPGMYATVTWPVRKAKPALLVPPTAVVTTTERTFVIRVKDGKAEWVNIVKGAPAGDLMEVFGPLQGGDLILKRATDEIREGSAIK